MADTTHNVTIKATLDTSSIGGGTGGTSSGSGGGSGGMLVGGMQAGAAQAQVQAARQQVDAARQQIQALKQFAVQMKLLSSGFSMMAAQLNLTNQFLNRIVSSNPASRLSPGTEAMNEVRKATRGVQVTLDDFAQTLRKANAIINEGFSQAMGESVNLSRAERRARRENVEILRRQNEVQRRVTQGQLEGEGLLKNMKKAFGAFGLQRFVDTALDIGENSGMMTSGEETSAVLSKHAAGGLAAGAMFGGYGALIGMGIGALTGGLEVWKRKMNESSDELDQLNEATENWVKRTREERKQREEALQSISQNARMNEVQRFVGQMDSYDKKFREIESNVEDFQGAIDMLDRALVNNKISIGEYSKRHAELSEKLQFEQQLLSVIKQKRQEYYDQLDAEQDELERNRKSSWDFLNAAEARDRQLKGQGAAEDAAKYGSLEEILGGLDKWLGEAHQEQALRNDFFSKMKKATVEGRFEDMEYLRKAFETHASDLEAALRNRQVLAGGLREIMGEMTTYKGLSARDMGTLAGLGGFGSETVMADPVLDLQREQNRILGDMLRAIREQDRSSRYL